MANTDYSETNSVTDASIEQQEKNKSGMWINNLVRRAKFLQDKTSERHWERYVREYQGDFSDLLGAVDLTKVIPLNLIYAYVRTEIPSLYLQDPYFEFTPKQRTTIGAAKLKEIAVNEMWGRKKFKREVKKGIQDAKIVGHAWFKVGYNANIGNAEESFDSTENNVEGDYFFYRLNWRHVLFNDEAVDPPYDATWMAQKFYIPLETAKANKDWKNTANLNGVQLAAGSTLENTSQSVSSSIKGNVKYAELYEVWDKVNKKVLIVSTQESVGVLHEREWPYTKMQGFPFLFLSLSFLNDDPYGISDVGMGEKHVLEKTKVRTAFLEHLKRGNRQLITTKDNFSAEMKDAYRKGDDSALLEVDNPEKVMKLPYAEFQNDVFGLESRLDDDLAQIWGQRPTDRAGAARTQTRTKFELQNQGVGTQARLAEQQNIIQDIVEEAVEKISCLLEQYATEPYYVNLTGFDPAKVAEMLANRPSALSTSAITNSYGFTLTGEDIKGPVDVRIKEGSAVPLDKQSKIKLLQEMAQMYMTMKARPNGPFIGAVAKMLVEESGLHELTDALEAEKQFEAEQAKQQQEQATQQAELAAGQKATELQLQAQELSTKQQKVESDASIELLQIMSDIKLQLADINQRISSEPDND